MKQEHPHAAAIDRIGKDAIIAHFGVVRQTIFYWRLRGVPEMHRKTLAMLGAVGGHHCPELAKPKSEIE